MYLYLNKYKDVSSSHSGPELFKFEPFGQWDLTEYLFDENLPIQKGLEFSDTFSFKVEYAELKIKNNSILAEQFTSENINEYIFGIRYSEDGYSSIAGEVIFARDATYFDDTKGNNTWVVSIRGWLKYHADKIEEYFLDQTFTNTADFLRKTFRGPEKPFAIGEYYSIIQSVEVEVRDDANWNIADQEWLLYKGQNPNIAPFNQGDFLNTHTYADLLLEAQKHFGAYLYVDGDLKLHFVNTQYRMNVYPAPFDSESSTIDITPLIYDESFIERFHVNNEYDGILISQEEVISETITEISWRMLRWINGEIEQTRMLSEEQIQDLPKGLSLIDLRQDLGWQNKGGVSDPIEAWDGAGSAYEKVLAFGYRIFPQRDYEDTLKDYEFLLKPLDLCECTIKNRELSFMQIVEAYSKEYQLFDFTEDRSRNSIDLVLRKIADV